MKKILIYSIVNDLMLWEYLEPRVLDDPTLVYKDAQERKSFHILLKKLKKFVNSDIKKVVIKPRIGCKGTGVKLIDVKKLDNEKKLPDDIGAKDYIIQEFKETAAGFQRIVNGRHDVRVQVCHNKPSLCYIRIAAPKKVTANYAQGGKILTIKYSDISKSHREKIEEIIHVFSNKFPFSHFSIDFGLDNNENFFVYEINNNMGWPNYHPLVENWAEELTQMLYKLSKK